MCKSKSTSGRLFDVKPNRKKRTFTIRVDGFKFRTYPMPLSEFNSMEYMTANDWEYFLRSTNDYYIVSKPK